MPPSHASDLHPQIMPREDGDFDSGLRNPRATRNLAAKPRSFSYVLRHAGAAALNFGAPAPATIDLQRLTPIRAMARADDVRSAFTQGLRRQRVELSFTCPTAGGMRAKSCWKMYAFFEFISEVASSLVIRAGASAPVATPMQIGLRRPAITRAMRRGQTDRDQRVGFDVIDADDPSRGGMGRAFFRRGGASALGLELGRGRPPGRPITADKLCGSTYF